MSEWIDIKDRLPVGPERVLVFPDPFGEVSEGYCVADGTWWSSFDDSGSLSPTHWQPLPSPPLCAPSAPSALKVVDSNGSES